jgi:hypothetical protein
MVGEPMRWICQERSALKGTPSAAIAGRATPSASAAARTRKCIIGFSRDTGGTRTLPQQGMLIQINGLSQNGWRRL